VSLFEGIYGFIVFFEIVDLLFELFKPIFKLLSQILDVKFHFLAFSFVVFLECQLLLLDRVLVLFECFLAVFTLRKVLTFKLLNAVLQRALFCCFNKSIFLLRNCRISLLQKSFDFFFVRILNCGLHAAVFLILAMEMEDDLCELGNLL
jgi:hypothetical protein